VSLLGEGLDWLIFDECAQAQQIIWEQYLRATLTDRMGKALFITTPRGYNWMYELYKRGQSDEFSEWKSRKAPSWENPHLNLTDIEEARQTLSDVAFAQEYGADFTMFVGRVYKEFDEQIHVIDMLPNMDREWRFYRTLDFGYENNFVCLYIAVQPQTDIAYVIREYVINHTSAERIAESLLEQEQEFADQGIVFEYTTCDPSGASWRATFAEKGIYTITRKYLIAHGLELVRQALRTRERGLLDSPGLFVYKDCLETIREFNLYSYPDMGVSEEPVKKDDHSLDSLRYWISHFSQGMVVQYAGVYV
jgi:hypothetical protein